MLCMSFIRDDYDSDQYRAVEMFSCNKYWKKLYPGYLIDWYICFWIPRVGIKYLIGGDEVQS